ncbi:MAG: TetR/AcrR family transcriptional regulator [Blautia sp.]|nr:TetR/AcrR family transcriptional regulator [Blautia sp.]MCM1201857.1 TetR/AcrR family transcriptional regulator [Bacteroides fragilis]
MARNKHPEETVTLILDVATRLFMEKGYEHTSIQDIIANLGGLSKGAIYHHFRSKEEILAAVTDRMTEESNRMLADIRDRKNMNGREKLQTIFKESINRPVQNEIFTAAPNFGSNPRLLFSMLRETMDDTAPHYIQPIIEQGIADGSIVTEHPQELAELIMLVGNCWMNPMMFDDSEEKACHKFMLFRQMMRGFGLDIVDDELFDRLMELTAVYQKNR